MSLRRGASQILFGMLPQQTVDLEGGVWRMVTWKDPSPLSVDQTALRAAILEEAAPWTANGNDGGLAAELHRAVDIEVVGVNEAAGVVAERFPKQWRCRVCSRLTTRHGQPCVCGSTSFAQLNQVAFHTCGALKEAQLPRTCPTHHEIAVRLPGTARVQELYFYCPRCDRTLSASGFPFQRCDCGEQMDRNVHRAAVVFSPHFAVLVNPPDPAAAARLRAGGGGARALEWILAGLGADKPGGGRQTVEGLVETMIQQGLSPEMARRLADLARVAGEVEEAARPGEIDLPDAVRSRAYDEAISLTSALEQGRVRIEDMVANTTPPLRTLYEGYRDSILEAGLSNVELLTKFPVATVAFGFTRGGTDPTKTTLQPFRVRGGLRGYGMVTKTEAILFQLDPVAVLRWLRRQCFDLPETEDPRDARLSILRALEVPRPTQEDPQPLGAKLLTLLHSYGHRLVRSLAVNAGVERESLAEYLLPHHLSVIVYTSARGQFVLGALQAMFETSLGGLLKDVVHGEARCPLDPGCRDGGGACMACLHLGEPSCRLFNRFLDRAVLFGPDGFLAPQRARV